MSPMKQFYQLYVIITVIMCIGRDYGEGPDIGAFTLISSFSTILAYKVNNSPLCKFFHCKFLLGKRPTTLLVGS